MRSQGEGAADQAVQGGGVAHFLFHAAHGVQHHGQTALFGGGQGAAAGNGHGVGQGMAGHAGRAVLSPHQITAQDFGLQLQVKHNRLTIGLVQTVHRQKRFHQRILIGQNLGGIGAGQETGVNAGEGNPRGAGGGFMAQGSKQKFLRSHGKNLHYLIVCGAA